MIQSRALALFGRHEIDASRTRRETVPDEVRKAAIVIDALLPKLKEVLAWRYPREFDRDALGDRVDRWDVALFVAKGDGASRLELLLLDGLGTHPIPVVTTKFVFDPLLGKADQVLLAPPPPLFEVHRILDPKTPLEGEIGRGGYLEIQRVLDAWHVAAWPESVSRDGVLALLERNGIVARHGRLVSVDEPDQPPLLWEDMEEKVKKKPGPKKKQTADSGQRTVRTRRGSS